MDFFEIGIRIGIRKQLHDIMNLFRNRNIGNFKDAYLCDFMLGTMKLYHLYKESIGLLPNKVVHFFFAHKYSYSYILAS